MVNTRADTIVAMAENGFFLRMPVDMKAALWRIAKREDRKLNSQIVRVLREWLATQGIRVAAPDDEPRP